MAGLITIDRDAGIPCTVKAGGSDPVIGRVFPIEVALDDTEAQGTVCRIAECLR